MRSPAQSLVLSWFALSISMGAQPPDTPGGYLTGIKPEQLLQLSGLPPQEGDTRDQTDRAVFKATRSSENSARWQLAQSDADFTAPGILNAFSCSLGFTPTTENFPGLHALIRRVTSASNAIAAKIKNEYKRKRPFLVDQGPTCVSTEGSLSQSFDFPSGHATSGWVAGLILAELWPHRETEILKRARQYGESRVFCGVHNISAVDAARTVGSGVAAMLHGSPAFRRDLEAVRSEIAHVHHTAFKSTAWCAAQAQALSADPYAVLPAH